MSSEQSPSQITHKIIRPLEALNFFMADIQAGVGPFLGIFLLAHGWTSVPIGTVMTIGGVAGMILWLVAHRREGLTVSALAFLKLGVVVMTVALLFALAAIWLL